MAHDSQSASALKPDPITISRVFDAPRGVGKRMERQVQRGELVKHRL